MKTTQQWIDWWIKTDTVDMQDLVRQAREEVREECAKLVEIPSDFPAIMDMEGLDVLAAAIRALDLK